MSSDTERQRKDDLSLHMRIPASLYYVPSVLLALDGICDHFDTEKISRDRIKKSLEAVLIYLIDLSYKDATGLFNLKFSVSSHEMQITIEDYLLDERPTLIEVPSEEEVRERLASVVNLIDEFSFYQEIGSKSCYSMQFNFLVQDNQ